MKPEKLLYITLFEKSYSAKRFQEEAALENIEFEMVLLTDLSLTLEKGKVAFFNKQKELKIDEKTMIIIRNPRVNDFQMISILAELAELKGAKLINSDFFRAYPNFEDKLIQSTFFHKNKLEHIKTSYFNTYKEAAAFFETYNFSAPIIVKPRMGSMGMGISIVDSKESMLNKLCRLNVREYVFQEFIPNDYDLRVIVTKRGVFGAMKRSRTKGIVNNYSAGGLIEKFDLDEDTSAFSKKVLSLLKADYIGLDLVFDKVEKKYKILEVNRFCQFFGFESVAENHNFPKEIINLI